MATTPSIREIVSGLRASCQVEDAAAKALVKVIKMREGNVTKVGPGKNRLSPAGRKAIREARLRRAEKERAEKESAAQKNKKSKITPFRRAAVA